MSRPSILCPVSLLLATVSVTPAAFAKEYPQMSDHNASYLGSLAAMADLRAINAQFIDNYVTNNVVAHDALLHPAFVYVSPTGKRVDRATYLSGWATGFDPAVVIYWDVRDEHITLVGNVALVRSTNRQVIRSGGTDTASMSTYTDTYIFEDGRWRCIQAQISSVSKANEPADDTIIAYYIKGRKHQVRGERHGQGT